MSTTDLQVFRRPFALFDPDSSGAFKEGVRTLKGDLETYCRFLGRSPPTSKSTIDELLNWCFGELQECDVFVVLLEEDLKRWMCLVIGVAIFLGKEIIILAPEKKPVSGHLSEHVRVVSYGDLEEATRLIRETVCSPLFEARPVTLTTKPRILFSCRSSNVV